MKSLYRAGFSLYLLTKSQFINKIAAFLLETLDKRGVSHYVCVIILINCLTLKI